MHRGRWTLLGILTTTALGVACLWPVLFRDQQFAFRDAGHYFYPLHLRVQQEWNAGRLPLWLPDENAGASLIGNPTAAVLYPGKLVFAALPYPHAARAYVILHLALAAGAMAWFALGIGISPPGAILAALSYAFGAPVLCLYANVIYLVGAAWLPLGILAVDHLVRRGHRRALGGLAVVLALQVLGGDPQAAYLTGAAGGLYALGLTLAGPLARVGARRLGLLLVPAFLFWMAAVSLAAILAVRSGTPATPPSPSRGLYRALIWLFLAVAIIAGLWRHRRREPIRLLNARLVRLGLAAALAGFLAGVQLLPTLEVAQQSFRAAEGATFGQFRFSLEPLRLMELFWPNGTGAPMPENRCWLTVIDPLEKLDYWTPSIYLGAGTLLLALGAITPGMRLSPKTPPAVRAGLIGLVIVGFACGLGRHAGPLGHLRRLPALSAALGPRDLPDNNETRPDGTLPDGAGSPYGLFSAALPGFGDFRFPAKLLTLAALGLAALAGIGWDRLRAGPGRWFHLRGLFLAGVGALAWMAVTLRRSALIASWTAAPARISSAGPLDAAGAVEDLQRGLLHGTLVVAGLLAIARLAPRRPALAGGLAIVGLALDLALANAGLIWTAPQALFDAPSAAVTHMAADAGGTEGFATSRVFRMPSWLPTDFTTKRSPHRIAEIVAWERDTLQPNWGLAHGVSFALSPGVMERADYLWYFYPRMRPLSAANAAFLKIPDAQEILYYPRRGVDLWGARYFILPIRTDRWMSESRGYAAFMDHSTLIAPTGSDIPTAEGRTRWQDAQDWQIYRNEDAYPRAWVVHDARVIPPVTEADRERVFNRLLYQNDALWSDPSRSVLDLRETALVEHDDPRVLVGALERPPEGADESLTVRPVSSSRVEIDAKLDAAGLVVLADIHDSGWRLTLDGEPAPILRVNRLMRGAIVPAGKHRLVYTYWPRSVTLGAIGTLAGLCLLGLVLLRRPSAAPASPSLEPSPWEPANRLNTPPTSASASPEPTSTTSSEPPPSA